jgi:hypothetical protein
MPIGLQQFRPTALTPCAFQDGVMPLMKMPKSAERLAVNAVFQVAHEDLSCNLCVTLPIISKSGSIPTLLVLKIANPKVCPPPIVLLRGLSDHHPEQWKIPSR